MSASERENRAKLRENSLSGKLLDHVNMDRLVIGKVKERQMPGGDCMANLADDIEQYLKEHLDRAPVIEVQRAILAARFGCAPSQINYVLATRFSPERGYLVESRRGGGGYIRIIRLNLEEGDALHELVHREIGDSLSQEEALGYISRLQEQKIIDDREAAVMAAAVHRETIRLDLPARDIIRANLLRAMILAILRFT